MRAAASRSGGPQACPAGCARHSVRSKRIDIRTETIVPHPPPHSFERLLQNTCCGLPHPIDGSFAERWRARLHMVFVHLRSRRQQCGPIAFYCGFRRPGAYGRTGLWFLRALRPASTRLLSPITPLRHLISASYSPKNVSATPCGALRDDCGPRFAFLGRTSFRTAPPIPREPGRNRI